MLRDGRSDFLDYDTADWRRPGLDRNVIVLAKNAVIMAYAENAEKIKYPRTKDRVGRFENRRKPETRHTGWKVSAVAREDGAEIWSIDLPEEPLYNGLGIAGDRSILVALCDGSVVCLRKD